MYNRKIITTKDGYDSILVEDLGETFHSIHGALNEALLVYIQNGLAYASAHKPEVSVLEMGFGTGLNAFLSLKYAVEKGLKVDYYSLEAYPLKEAEWLALNYTKNSEEEQLFEKIHRCEWDKQTEIVPNFTLTKRNVLFEEYEPSHKVDLIYFDVFGYNYQPYLWDEQMFLKMKNSLNPNGALVTYACKGLVTKTLRKLGFEVEKLQGPPGKREMTRAILI